MSPQTAQNTIGQQTMSPSNSIVLTPISSDEPTLYGVVGIGLIDGMRKRRRKD